MQYCNGSCQWDACQGSGCQPGTTQACGACGLQHCNGSCAWDPCGNEGGTIWQYCNQCGWQYCMTDGSGWYDCVGNFQDQCPDPYCYYCYTDGWCYYICY